MIKRILHAIASFISDGPRDRALHPLMSAEVAACLDYEEGRTDQPYIRPADHPLNWHSR